MYPKSPTTSLLGFGFSGNNMLPTSTAPVNGFNGYSGGTGSGGSGSGGSGSSSQRASVGNGTQQFFQPRGDSVGSMQFQPSGTSGNLGSTSPIGHFHIGTFNANSMYGDETTKGSAAAATLGLIHQGQVGNGNGVRGDIGGTTSPNNLGSRETGIIEKLLVGHENELCGFLRLTNFLLCSILTGLFNAVNARLVCFSTLVSLMVISNI